MEYDKLFSQALEVAEPKVEGEWFPITLTPDVATGERLNIGVGIIKDGITHVRMLESMRAFKCLYGEQGAENIQFLIDIVKDHLEESSDPTSPSANIYLGDRRHTAGDNIQQLLDELYHTMVPLGAGSEITLMDRATPSTIDNNKLRKHVFDTIRSRSRPAYDRFIKTIPTRLSDNEGSVHEIDLQILDDKGDHFAKKVYGSIVSAFYVSHVYRGFNLNSATTALMTASQLLNDGAHGGLFVLMPDRDEPGYDEKTINEIENDIDKATWALTKTSDVEIHIATSPEALTDDVLAMTH